MRPPLTHCRVRDLVRRLCALPTVRRGLFEEAVVEGSSEWGRMERLLRRAARSDEHAAEIVRICEAGLLRPNAAAIAEAARRAERASMPSIDEPRDRRGRSRCVWCDGTKFVSELRASWTEMTDDGPRKRSRKVESEREGYELMDRLGVRGDVFSCSAKCSCQAVAEAAK